MGENMRKRTNTKYLKKNFKRIIAMILLLAITMTGVNFNFITASAETETTTLYFIDNTIEKWVGKNLPEMELVDNTNGHDSYWMTKIDEVTWCVSVPVSAYNITFNRYQSNKETKWNS